MENLTCCRREYEDEKWSDLIRQLDKFAKTSSFSFPDIFIPVIGMIPGLNDFLTGNKVIHVVSLCVSLCLILVNTFDLCILLATLEITSTYAASDKTFC